MLGWARWLAVSLLIDVAIIVAVPVFGLAYGFLSTDRIALYRSEPTVDAPSLAIEARLAEGIEGYKRPPQLTFLAHPEWASAYAARDYAGLTGTKFPSAFPYWGYVGRFWKDYALMIRAASDYPFHIQDHWMLLAIGVSLTSEHITQSLYENTLGRLSEAAAGWRPVPEDRFQAEVAAEYARFLDQHPWYRFAYGEKRSGLWAVEPAKGWAAIRSWERKLAFGLAYSIKQGYAVLINTLLVARTEAAPLEIHVWASGPVAAAISDETNVKFERDLGEAGAVFAAGRYQAFTDMVPRLIDKGVRFIEIGGNRLILLTVLTDGSIVVPQGSQALFAYGVPSHPATKRIGLAVEVPLLHEILPALVAAGARLEHVYDF